MEESKKKKSFIQKLKKHKKVIIGISICAGVTALAVVSSVVLKSYKNKIIKQKSDLLNKPIDINIKNDIIKEKTFNNKKVYVPYYFRNLPKGQKASTKKIMEASQKGINLPKNKTLVDEYSYNKRCA